MAGNLGYIKPGAKYAGDAPGNAPYGYGASERQMVNSRNQYTPSAGGDAAYARWLGSLPANPETPPQLGADTMTPGVLQGNIAKGPTQTSALARGFNPRAGRPGLTFGSQPGSSAASLTRERPGRPETTQAASAPSLFSNLAQVSTSITPKPIYSPELTNMAVNNAVAEQHQAANPDVLMKATDRPGRSRDAGSLATALPAMAEADVGARMAKAGIPLNDYFANENNVLRGELARDREGLGYANLGARLLANQVDARNGQGALDDARLQMVMSMLGLG